MAICPECGVEYEFVWGRQTYSYFGWCEKCSRNTNSAYWHNSYYHPRESIVNVVKNPVIDLTPDQGVVVWD